MNLLSLIRPVPHAEIGEELRVLVKINLQRSGYCKRVAFTVAEK